MTQYAQLLSSWMAGETCGRCNSYWENWGSLSVANSLLLHVYGDWIIIPQSLQKRTLEKVHEGHQRIQRCRSQARQAVWWPNITQHINDLVKQCDTCVKRSRPTKQPMIITQLPEYPWQRVGTDLFQLDGATFLIVIDYFSRYPEVMKLRGTTSSDVIELLKAIFSRHGIPETVISDNRPQFSSWEFRDFAQQ